MTTRTCPHRLHLIPSLTDRGLAAVQRALARWLQRRAERHEADLAMAVERELRRLDPRTLADIGAPQGLVGQRRGQAEQDAWSREQMLRSHGW
jgi:uncharacterized protein YjiS (DUF1127 family)